MICFSWLPDSEWLMQSELLNEWSFPFYSPSAGADLGGGCRGCATPPPPKMTCGFLIQLVFCKKKNYVVYWCWSRARDKCTPSWKKSWIRPRSASSFCFLWRPTLPNAIYCLSLKAFSKTQVSRVSNVAGDFEVHVDHGQSAVRIKSFK